MKKLVLTAAIFGLMTSGAALADGLDNAVGHTVRVIVNDAGEGFDVYFDAAGAFSDSLGRSGTWEYGEELCIMPPEEAGPDAEPACGPWDESLSAGGEWQTGEWSDDDTVITFTILEGRGHDAPTPPTPPTD